MVDGGFPECFKVNHSRSRLWEYPPPMNSESAPPSSSRTASVIDLVEGLASAAHQRVDEIQTMTWSMRMLSLNARIEAARAGEAGDGFGVVADQMQEMTDKVTAMVALLQTDVVERAGSVAEAGRQMASQARGRRLRDLSRSLIEILDRNLYERSCDVRWWATDAAVVGCCAAPATAAEAAGRLAVILRAYTVYADIWIVSRHGKVLANGRAEEHAGVVGSEVAREGWFTAALGTANGDGYTMGEIQPLAALGGRTGAIYATAVREGGATEGTPIGVLAVVFDWTTQSRAVVGSLALEAEERTRTRALILDAHGKILAASDGTGELEDRITLPISQVGPTGFFETGPWLVGYALTPGFETYPGQGWYGVVIQSR